MIRRFVNIVGENYRSGIYSLHRLDVSKHLFYPSTADAEAASASNIAAAAAVERSQQELPAPSMTFQPPSRKSSNLELFALVSPRISEGKILCACSEGHTLIYDADAPSLYPVQSCSEFKGPVPVSLSIARRGGKGDTYIIHHGAPGLESKSSCFDLLRLGHYDDPDWRGKEGWHSLSLPLPPFVHDPQYKPAPISSYTVLDGGRVVCLSSAAEGIGTYCFDTLTCEWKQAGEWVLPFNGGAEYVPGLNLWLGFAAGTHRLCATSDLSAMAMDKPPMLQYDWQDLTTPEEWTAIKAKLLDLGSGRFCVAKVFRVDDPNKRGSGYFSDADGDLVDNNEFAVLTGLEIFSSGGHPRVLQMVKHKSIRYNCANNGIRWVL